MSRSPSRQQNANKSSIIIGRKESFGVVNQLKHLLAVIINDRTPNRLHETESITQKNYCLNGLRRLIINLQCPMPVDGFINYVEGERTFLGN